MVGKPMGAAAARELERLFAGGTALGCDEPRLLERFANTGDEAAFAALVARHGPMVLAVCRRLLDDPNDADDAFQATFLVLARRARALGSRPTVGPWLREVARRVSRKVRIQSYKRTSKIDTSTDLDALISPDSVADLDGRWAFEDELSRLPERYRVPLWLCYAEGMSHEEAASRLGCPLGTVKGRLTRARELVRTRLARRGVTASNAFEGFFLAVRVAPQVPLRLYEATLKAAVKVAAGCSLAGATSGAVATLVQGGLSTMMLTQVKLVAGGGLAAAALVAGTVFAGQRVGSNPKQDPPAAQSRIELAQASGKMRTESPRDTLKPAKPEAKPLPTATPTVAPEKEGVAPEMIAFELELALEPVAIEMKGLGPVLEAFAKILKETKDPLERARIKRVLQAALHSRLQRMSDSLRDAEKMIDNAFAEEETASSNARSQPAPRDLNAVPTPLPGTRYVGIPGDQVAYEPPPANALATEFTPHVAISREYLDKLTRPSTSTAPPAPASPTPAAKGERKPAVTDPLDLERVIDRLRWSLRMREKGHLSKAQVLSELQALEKVVADRLGPRQTQPARTSVRPEFNPAAEKLTPDPLVRDPLLPEAGEQRKSDTPEAAKTTLEQVRGSSHPAIENLDMLGESGCVQLQEQIAELASTRLRVLAGTLSPDGLAQFERNAWQIFSQYLRPDHPAEDAKRRVRIALHAGDAGVLSDVVCNSANNPGMSPDRLSMFMAKVNYGLSKGALDRVLVEVDPKLSHAEILDFVHKLLRSGFRKLSFVDPSGHVIVSTVREVSFRPEMLSVPPKKLDQSAEPQPKLPAQPAPRVPIAVDPRYTNTDKDRKHVPLPYPASPPGAKKPDAEAKAKPPAANLESERRESIADAFVRYRKELAVFLDQNNFDVESPIKAADELYRIEMKYAGSKAERLAAADGQIRRIWRIQQQITKLNEQGEAPQSAVDATAKAIQEARQMQLRIKDSRDGIPKFAK